MARTPQDPKIRITEILDAAEDLFAVKGYRGTTISDISKEMGVAQGMLYYYFKSKEDILEAILNRHGSTFIFKIKDMVCSSITPSEKIGLTIGIILDGVRYKDEVFLNTVHDEQNLHIKDRLARQLKLLLTPWVLKTIEEGCSNHDFNVSHPQTAVDFIHIITEFLINTLYEKIPDELLSPRLKMAEALIEKTLGAQEGTIHIRYKQVI